MPFRNALHVSDVHMGYGAAPVLRGATLGPLAAGSVNALVGPNGAGKSTLLRGLAGLQRMRGEVRLGTALLSSQPPVQRARQVVYVPQSLPERSRLAVFESVLSAAMAGEPAQAARGWPLAGTHEAEPAVEQVLQRLELTALADRPLAALSGGQRQMVGLAQALVRRPRLLLLDEPTSALDLYHQHRVLDVVTEIAHERQLVVLAVLHDINLAMGWADRIMVLDQGRVVRAGSPVEVVDSALLHEVYRVQAVVETVNGRRLVAVRHALGGRGQEPS